MYASSSGNAQSTAQVHVMGARKAALWQEVVISGISVGTATTFTNPFDVIKTRLQLRSRGAVAARGPGLLGTGVLIVREEGLLSLWKGLTPAVTRGFLYGGMRLGLYGPCRDLLLSGGASLSHTATTTTTGSSISPPSAPSATPQGLTGLGLKATAGVISGAAAAGLTSPTELIKTRLQAAQQDCQGAQGGPVAVVRQVVRERGVAGLWRGALPSMARAALLTASQVAAYDSIKREVVARSGWGDSLATHLAASGVTGLVTTTVTNPADVVKTRMFVSAGSAARQGIAATIVHIARTDGLAGFLKGWTANFARLGPQTVITFLTSEALRQALGLQGL